MLESARTRLTEAQNKSLDPDSQFDSPTVPRTGTASDRVTPGVLAVVHAELGDGRFSFTLQLACLRRGLLMRQAAAFREAER
jgi:hypothetical protein